jgi:hypothetical protein
MRRKLAVIIALLAVVAGVLLAAGLWGGFGSGSRPEPAPAPAAGPVAAGGKRAPPGPCELRPDRARLKLIGDPRAGLERQLGAVRGLGPRLRRKLVLDAIAVLRDPRVREVVRNDLLGRLELQAEARGLLARPLLEMWDDSRHSPLWRNYCLQHMAPVWELEPAARQEIEVLLFEVAGKAAGLDGATAMRSLHRIGARDEQVAGRLRGLAAGLLPAGGKRPDAERLVTALHVLAGAGDGSVLGPARRLAADTKARARVRMAAMSVLGRIGERRDAELLEELAGSTRSRVKTAAEKNLGLLRARLGKG